METKTALPTKLINLSSVKLEKEEINLLLLGLSFTPTPKHNVHELEKDIFEFTRKLRLIYHFRNDNYVDESVIKKKSTYTPRRKENTELDKICDRLDGSPIKVKKSMDNLGSLKSALVSIKNKINSGQIIIKPADKGSIVVVLSPERYWDMCKRHLDDSSYYSRVDADPSNIVQEQVRSFARKFKEILTDKEYEYLVFNSNKLSNFYMLPKLHKCQKINDTIGKLQTEYIHIEDDNLILEGRPINSGPCYFTRGLSLILHEVLLPCLSYIKYIVKDTFDFQEKMQKECPNDCLLATWDIKSLYVNIKHTLFLDAVFYWITKFQTQLPLLSRFTIEFVMEGLKIILSYNYFTINNLYLHQLKGIAMGSPVAVVGSNLVVAFLEMKMFNILPQIYPADFVDFFVRNYFRFLDDLAHKWLKKFNIKEFSEILNSLDEDLKFLMDHLACNVNFLDVNITVKNGRLFYDMYYKPTNSFSFLKYSSCHPKHTRNNIALSLGRRIVKIVSHERDIRLGELKEHLLQRNYPEPVINSAFSKLFEPSREPTEGELVTFVYTYNPNHQINLQKFRHCLKNMRGPSLRAAFENTSPLVTTRQPSNLRKILTKASFTLNPLPKEPRLIGLYPCGKCVYCKNGYITHRTEFTLRHDGRQIRWRYTRFFSCESMNILYVVICLSCSDNYLGKTKNAKSRMSKHKSDVLNPHNSKCRQCVEHLRKCSSLKEPYFAFLPFFYVDDPSLRHFMEKRFIDRWKPPLNINH